MSDLADEARIFWSAAFFYRRASTRDRSKAVEIINHLTASPFGRIAGLSQHMMKEIDNERACEN